MGALTDFIAAAPDSAASLVEQEPVESPDRVFFKRVDHVKLSTLNELMTGQSIDGFLRDLRTLAGSDDGPYVEQLPTAFRDALARTSKAKRLALAEKWAVTPELTSDGFDRDTALAVIDALASIAERAQSTGREMLFWWCL